MGHPQLLPRSQLTDVESPKEKVHEIINMHLFNVRQNVCYLRPSRCVASHSDQLSLAIPPWVGAVSISVSWEGNGMASYTCHASQE